MRHARNIIVVAVVFIIMFFFTAYLSGALYVGITFGIQKLNFNVIQPNFRNIPYSLFPTIVYYIIHWAKSRHTYSDINQLKLFASVGIPYGILFASVWGLRSNLMDWLPFKKRESIHGDAKWADEDDIRKAGLRSKKGLIMGKDKKGFLIADGFQHTLLFAPTGSGKGVGFVIPNLLFWTDSVFVHDIKLENYELTSGWRKSRGQKVYCWCPANPDGKSHCYNPLDWISTKKGQMVDDVQKIGSLLMPEQDFWVNEARSLFLGVVLYLVAVPEKITSFGEVVRTMRSDDVTYNLAVVLDTLGDQIHPVAYMNIVHFSKKLKKKGPVLFQR